MNWIFYTLLAAAGILSWYFLIIKPWIEKKGKGKGEA